MWALQTYCGANTPCSASSRRLFLWATLCVLRFFQAGPLGKGQQEAKRGQKSRLEVFVGQAGEATLQIPVAPRGRMIHAV